MHRPMSALDIARGSEKCQPQVVARSPRRRPLAWPNGRSVVMPRRLREHNLLGPGQTRGSNPVKLPILPLPDPPVLFIKVILQLETCPRIVPNVPVCNSLITATRSSLPTRSHYWSGDRECCAPASLLREALCKTLISCLTT